jgi:hypothetical protein
MIYSPFLGLGSFSSPGNFLALFSWDRIFATTQTFLWLLVDFFPNLLQSHIRSVLGSDVWHRSIDCFFCCWTDLGPSQDCLGSCCWTDLGPSGSCCRLVFGARKIFTWPRSGLGFGCSFSSWENVAERISAVFLLRILCGSAIQVLGSSESVRLGSSSWLTNLARLLCLFVFYQKTARETPAVQKFYG